MSYFGGHWSPCFGFLVTSPVGFKARVGSALFAFCGGECNVHSPRSTSGATLCQPLGSQHAAPHACAEVGLGSDLNGQSPGQKTNALPLCQWPSKNEIEIRKYTWLLTYVCTSAVVGCRAWTDLIRQLPVQMPNALPLCHNDPAAYEILTGVTCSVDAPFSADAVTKLCVQRTPPTLSSALGSSLTLKPWNFPPLSPVSSIFPLVTQPWPILKFHS